MSDLTMKYNPAFLSDETLIRSFVVRHRELETVLEVVRENDGDANQHVLIIGPRGIGKSTLVLRVAAEIRRDPALAARWYPVVYGEESYLVTNVGELWLEALLQVAEQTGAARWHEAHDSLESERDPERLARRALAQLMDFADEEGKRLLLLVENLNTLIGSQITSDKDAWALRRTLQTEPRLMLLGTATRRFDQIDDEGQALYEFFRIVDLDPLDSLDDIGRLWGLAQEGETPRAYLRPVEILTGGNPRLIRILSEFAARTSFNELMENLVHLMDEHTEYFKHHLDILAPTERKVFVALADRWDPGTARDLAGMIRMDVSAVSALLSRLEQRGAVRVIGQRGRTKVYQVAERLYNIYHLMRRRGQASARVRAAVRFMVRYYEGDRLLPAIQSLVREVCALAPERRHDHYLAYSEVLDLAEPALRDRILAETRAQIEDLPDLPDHLRERLRMANGNPYDGLSLTELAVLDVSGISAPEQLDMIGAALIRLYREAPSAQALGVLLATFDRAVELSPGDADAHYNRGVALARLGRHEEALAAYDRAVELRPDHANAHGNRGAALADLGRHEEALVAYDRAVELRPGYTIAHYNQGVTLTILERYEEALAAYDRAVGLQPDHADAYGNRGNVLARLGRYEEALVAYDRAVELRPDDFVGHFGRSQVHLLRGKTDVALSALSNALESSGAPRFVPYVVSLTAQLAAGGATSAVLDRIVASPLAPEVEPLLVALRMDLGEQVDVAREIQEVARDILAQIEAERAELSASP
jgi:tetratricopeptide (TPR) repeat protein